MNALSEINHRWAHGELTNLEFAVYHLANPEAAEELAELRAENARLRKLLEPFAREGELWSTPQNQASDNDVPLIRWQGDSEETDTEFTVRDLRNAAAELKGSK